MFVISLFGTSLLEQSSNFTVGKHDLSESNKISPNNSVQRQIAPGAKKEPEEAKCLTRKHFSLGALNREIPRWLQSAQGGLAVAPRDRKGVSKLQRSPCCRKYDFYLQRKPRSMD